MFIVQSCAVQGLHCLMTLVLCCASLAHVYHTIVCCTRSTLFNDTSVVLCIIGSSLSYNRVLYKVYIVTMEEHKEQQKQNLSKVPQSKDGATPGDDDEDSPEFSSYLTNDGESLLSLVQPEVNRLSKHWLSALKDYALLSLPAGAIVICCLLTMFECLGIPKFLIFN